MRNADLISGGAKLRNALKLLLTRWEQTKLEWHDGVSRQFEETYIQLLEPEIRGELDRLANLAQVLSEAEHDCSPDRG